MSTTFYRSAAGPVDLPGRYTILARHPSRGLIWCCRHAIGAARETAVINDKTGAGIGLAISTRRRQAWREIPRQWYNILADIKMNPPLGPDGKPVTPDMLAPVFPMNLIEQEVSTQRWIDIPDEVLGSTGSGARAPLVRAFRSRRPWTPPRGSTSNTRGSALPGSHKPNTAVPQAYYNKVFGIKRWSPRPAPASGAAPWPLPAPSSGWSARSSWCGSASTRSPTARS
jgi:hypothetical protein